MSEEEVIKFVSENNCRAYLLTVHRGDIIVAKWDDDQEHFYSYLNGEDARRERERHERECRRFDGAGMPGSAEEAASMYIGTPKALRMYRIIKPSQVDAISAYMR